MKIKTVLRYAGWTLLSLPVLLIGITALLYGSADMKQPEIPPGTVAEYPLVQTDSLRVYGPNHLRRSASGLWEMRLTGTPAERGVAFGKMASDLLYYQEKVFVDQIRQIVPSDRYLKFLRFFLILFNRNLGASVPEEYRTEIYGLSLSCTHEYDAIGTPYERQLNYHAAHDIGHAMQDYMLVGCSSFAVWGAESADSALLIGRNFDFYAGDDFARHKLVSFYEPTQGYRFASVGWAGMTGVLSGMNETGLTVTINAAKSSPPIAAAMPISLLAREILQYASTIDEAYALARKHQTFVAESLLIGSARDGKAAVIEKSPDRIALFEAPAGSQQLICTNHYQSDAFADDPHNRENIATSDSPYRYARLQELIGRDAPLSPQKTAAILRDRFGKGDREIGLANEKAINQFIAHHSVIFQPEKRIMWVSTAPWQSGKFVAYDLNRVFASSAGTGELSVDSLSLSADTFLQTPAYTRLLAYRSLAKQLRAAIRSGIAAEETTLRCFLESNPQLYDTWRLAGDYYQAFGSPERAVSCWEKALTKEIPRLPEGRAIEEKIKKIKKI